MKPMNLSSERVKRLHVPTAILGLDLSPDEQQAYVATFAGVGVLDIESEKFELLYSHDSYASGVAHIADLNQIVSAGYDGQLKWFDLENRSVIRTLAADDSWIWDLAVLKRPGERILLATASGQYLAGDYEYRPLPSSAPNVQVWDAVSGARLHLFNMLPPVQAVALSPCGNRVAAANLMGDICVWDLRDNEHGHSNRVPDWHWKTNDFTAFGVIKSHCQVGGIYAVTFTPDSQNVIVAGMGPMVDPMAGNGRQRWQRFSMEDGQADQKWQSKDDQVGEGLMEAITTDSTGNNLVMSGRLRGGAFNTGVFSLASGELLHGFKTDSRVTQIRYLQTSGDEIAKRLILAGALNQSKDPAHQFGVVDIFRLQTVDGS